MSILALVLIFVVVMAASRRTPRSDDGVADFQRHLSALSPESRRSVIDYSNQIAENENMNQNHDEDDDNGA